MAWPTPTLSFTVGKKPALAALMASSFWGPMAVAISSGLLVATVLTLLVLPTMYAVAYKVENK